MSDFRQRYAEAIAAAFTYPVHRCDRDGENERVENAEPADRIDQPPYVMVTAEDGCRSFWTPTCLEIAAVVAAVRDEEVERLRAALADYENVITWDTTCRDHARLLDECRSQEERAEKAEQELAENTGVIQALRRQRDTAEAGITHLEKRVAHLERRCGQASDTIALVRDRLDILIAAGFGAVTDTLRELRAILDNNLTEAPDA